MGQLIDQIKRHEGLSLTAYHCPAGKITIGYGRNLEGKGISQHEADQMLVSDVDEIIESFQRLLPFWSEINLARKSVLINMAYNIGIQGLFKFKKTLSLISGGDYHLASKEMLNSKWH